MNVHPKKCSRSVYENSNNSNEIEIISQNVSNNALYQSEEECKDQESIQSSTTPDSGHGMEK